ncbi:DUF3885 domain-containing protein [Flavihumibacter petaseus]|uniref:DUF3885 domain-containing protein n=1 Tax=Flavihumibacter petaseus NBRC 106054 TaxID=1220578 RepID=A0A0E9N4M5_9BACT|nr:hypothetical protein [Flavihumibacter petaseus]GAO44784.1 hypothetical protein FPE01S_04_00270 [Flavihumibacter petaseus NBRC 106054]
MTKENFQKLWTLHYPDTVPISYQFKHDYSDRWFRIHSLPDSKRYPEDENEWQILLSRQNEIFTDLFGPDTQIFIVAGEYNWGENRQIHITDEEEIFKPFSFVKLDNIQLNRNYSEQYDEPDIYKPAFAKTIWKPKYHDKLLREIANDNTRAFFISFDKNVIVAPYDGGVDFVLKDILTKEDYRNKYRGWLSKREDGM